MDEKAGLTLGRRNLRFMVPREKALLLIECDTGGDTSRGFGDIDRKYAAAKPLFLLISASCVFPGKWESL